MLAPGALRDQLAGTLRNAYADGLLSEGTFTYRVELLLSSRLIDTDRLIGDLTARSTHRWSAIRTALGAMTTSLTHRRRSRPTVLALDWEGPAMELLVGRHPACDVVLPGPSVSRRHARMTFRDGRWILRDLESTNGTTVNRMRVGRCELRPGDRLVIGEHELLID